MKEERSFKVVLKNIYSSINLEELKQDISKHSNKQTERAAKNYKEILIHVSYGIKTSN
jgi:hypothetical protein